MNDLNRKKVIVCGVGFGQFYLRALELLKKEYELVGILSKGSDISLEYANKYGVPLFTDISEALKMAPDLACVVVKSTVVGGSGSQIAQEFLKHKINVIQEHPVHLAELVQNVRLAKSCGCRYILNTFYPNLKRVSDFIQTSHILMKHCAIQYIHATCSIHVLFPLIDILGRITGGFRPWEFKLLNGSNENVPFSIISGNIRGIPLSINVQNEIEPENPENNTLLLHAIDLFTMSGKLTLTGTNGIIVWEPCMNKKLDKNGVFRLDRKDEFLKLPTYEILGNQQEIRFRQMFLEEWTKSIKKSLECFCDLQNEPSKVNNELQYAITATEVWQDLGKILGNAKIIKKYEKAALSLKAETKSKKSLQV